MLLSKTVALCQHVAKKRKQLQLDTNNPEMISAPAPAISAPAPAISAPPPVLITDRWGKDRHRKYTGRSVPTMKKTRNFKYPLNDGGTCVTPNIPCDEGTSVKHKSVHVTPKVKTCQDETRSFSKMADDPNHPFPSSGFWIMKIDLGDLKLLSRKQRPGRTSLCSRKCAVQTSTPIARSHALSTARPLRRELCANSLT